MFPQNRWASGCLPMSNWLRTVSWLLIAVLALSVSVVNAQQLTATLNGIAVDQTDARIPGAKVVVTNEATGDVRASKTDEQGFFTVTALIPGTYTLLVSAKGFSSLKETGILLNQGDSRTVPNIRLRISADANAVTVISGLDAEVPVDTAEVSATLNNELIDTATMTGRNAAELIKMMPGVAFNNNGSVGGYSSTTTGTNNGPAGSFSANGTQPYGSTDVYLDGANLIDPGNAGTQVANINQDMTDSIKYLSASYGAEYAKGPAVLQAFSKNPSQKYHGEAYLYGRDSSLFANDWHEKQQQLLSSTPHNDVQSSYYYYMGGNVGGPVQIPFLKSFNRNKDKMFFWGGYEYMLQHPFNSSVQMNVPTAAQKSGDFTNSGIPTGVYNPDDGTGQYNYAYWLPCWYNDWWQGCGTTNAPWGQYGDSSKSNANGTPPNLKSYFDPNGVTMAALMPTPNQTPLSGNGWTNYIYTPKTPTDRWEATGKVTYSFSDNTKLWGSFAYQSETDPHPLYIWWAPTWTVPYPGGVTGKETANVYLANFTHVFNPTTTNEFVFAYSRFKNSSSMDNEKATSRSALGFPTQGVFGSAHAISQIPNFTDSWQDQLPWIYQFNFNGGIFGNNSFGKLSVAPSFADTFTKTVRTHTIKAGVYWDAQENKQSTGAVTSGVYNGQGEFNVTHWGSSSTYNTTADLLMGRIATYSEANSTPVEDLVWHQWSVWAQDAWKVTSKLQVTIGLRADHMGQWVDKIGDAQVWDFAAYDNSTSAAANTGLTWHAKDSSVPRSGFTSPVATFNPRVGVTYDVFGTGKTVVRAGFGTYRYQISAGDAGGAMAGPLGAYSYNTSSYVSSFYGYSVANGTVNTNACYLSAYPCYGSASTTTLTIPSGANQTGASGVTADLRGDKAVPYANTYSFGVAQALPGHTVLEVSYVGSASRKQLLNGTNNLNDQNPIKYGAYFSPNPDARNSACYGQTWFDDAQKDTTVSGGCYVTATTTDNWNKNNYRSMLNYPGEVIMVTHGGYANYNSLQISGQKQSGNLYLFSNFTFGKVLGTRDGSTANGNGNGYGPDPYHLANNYGPLGYDHTKVFNLSLTYKLPAFVHNHRYLQLATNGWQVSNYTTYQDGGPYQATYPTMNAAYDNSAKTQFNVPAKNNGTQLYSTQIDQATWFGTDEYPSGLQPVLVCDPRKGLKSGQYFNPKCFTAPAPPTATTYGQQGQWVWPYIRNPHYWGSDLAIFKTFKLKDDQRVEVRISATNWLNHPNAQFYLSNDADNYLHFSGASSGSTLVYNDNASTTGIPAGKTGYRWIQWTAKYYF